MLSRRRMVWAGAAALGGVALGRGPALAGETILAVGGSIDPSPAGGDRRFTLVELEALGTVSFKVHTPWYKDPSTFEGVPMRRLMGAVGARGDTARIAALNDYTVDIPMSDFAEDQPILAMRRDGALMPVADKGPLFVIYNYDARPEAQHELYYTRSVWQVCRIDVI